MKQVIIMRGLPGSGKTTLVEKIEEEYGEPALVCSADHFFYHGKPKIPENYVFDKDKLYFAHKNCKAKFNEAIQTSTSLIIVDNTNIKLKEYKWYFLTAIENGYNVALHTITNCSIHQSHKNNVHNVPMESIEKMNNAFSLAPKEINGQVVEEKVYDFNELRGRNNGKSKKKNKKAVEKIQRI